MHRLILAALVAAFLLIACTQQATLEPVLVTMNQTDVGTTVTVTGDIIAFVDFYLDDALSPEHTDSESPFEFTQPHDGLDAGWHEIRVVAAVNVLGELSTVTRFVPFEVEGSTSPPPNPPGNPHQALIDHYNAQPRLLLQDYGALFLDGRYAPGVVKQEPIWYFRNLAASLSHAGDDFTSIPAEYHGADILMGTPDGGSHRNATTSEWYRVTLTRDAKVIIFWRGWAGSVPAWWTSNGWTVGPNYTMNGNARPTLSKVLPAGTHWFPGVAISGTTQRTYVVAALEADGSAPPKPVAPTGLALPEQRVTAPDWLHDVFTGLDERGVLVRHWHPELDPVYGSPFRHAHMSPAPAPLASTYHAAEHIRPEQHAGFKGLTVEGVPATINGASGSITLYTETHATISDEARVCTRYHSVRIAVIDESDGTLLADLRYKGDSGYPVRAGDGARITPPDCPEVADLRAADTSGRRMLRPNDRGYETWTFDLDPTAGEHINRNGLAGSLSINYPDASTYFDLSDLKNPVMRVDSDGRDAAAWHPFHGIAIQAADVLGGVPDDGVFYMDAYAETRLDAGDAGAQYNYMQPNLTLTFDTNDRAHPYDPWGHRMALVPVGDEPTANTNFEGQLQPVHVFNP